MLSLISRFIGNVKERIRKYKANRIRNIPDSYFRGYRRLAETEEEIKPFINTCNSCKHAVAFGGSLWYCDLKKCSYEPCHIRNQLTKADYNAGDKLVGGWVGLPPVQDVAKK